jgi:hypothetical protein
VMSRTTTVWLQKPTQRTADDGCRLGGELAELRVVARPFDVQSSYSAMGLFLRYFAC